MAQKSRSVGVHLQRLVMAATLSLANTKAAFAVAKATPTGSNGLAARTTLCNRNFYWHRCSVPSATKHKLERSQETGAPKLAENLTSTAASHVAKLLHSLQRFHDAEKLYAATEPIKRPQAIAP